MRVAGVDPHVEVRPSLLSITPAGVAERGRQVLAACPRQGLPKANGMAGGQAEDVKTAAAPTSRPPATLKFTSSY
jgi:hypothetical protein